MYKLQTLTNGLTLILVNLPHLDSITTLISVGAGSRYETKKINGISHFLEHMFFKGSRKYPSAEKISTLVDGIGAINNAATDKEVTFYWIKSAAKHIELSMDLLSSMLKESLLAEAEIEREKGVIVEELRMYRDNPAYFVWELYEKLQFGDQPLGWHIGGKETTIMQFQRQDFLNYLTSLYSPKNMAAVVVGKLPKNIEKLAKDFFQDLPANSQLKYAPFKKVKQTKPRLDVLYKKTDQANLVLGVEGYNRYDKKRYATRVLSVILGEGMSSRLFIQVRERRGLAYTISANQTAYLDTGVFTVYAGLKLEKLAEGLEVIKAELDRVAAEKVTEDDLRKAKEIIRGRIALRSESTNFLGEYFGTNFVLDRKIETFEELIEQTEAVTVEDVQNIARDLFQKNQFNLQIIAPIKNVDDLEKILNR